MKTIVLLVCLGFSSYAGAWCVTPSCRSLEGTHRVELQAYLEYLKAERDAGRMSDEKMRYLYSQKESELKEKRTSLSRPVPQQVIVR
jgi:hypothetical protein